MDMDLWVVLVWVLYGSVCVVVRIWCVYVDGVVVWLWVGGCIYDVGV